MAVRVAINGFGRIGRNILRAIAEADRNDIEVVAVNDLGPVETNAHLLRYDSVHGRFPGTVTVKGDTISLGNGAIKVTAERDPSKLPWKDLGVDIAMECTGIFTAKDKASAHLTAGAKLLAEKGVAARVVSVPCFEIFMEQDEAYRRAMIGDASVKIGVEAAIRQGWDAIIGDGPFVGMTGFGASAPYKDLYKHFGITAEAVAQAALAKLK